MILLVLRLKRLIMMTRIVIRDVHYIYNDSLDNDEENREIYHDDTILSCICEILILYLF